MSSSKFKCIQVTKNIMVLVTDIPFSTLLHVDVPRKTIQGDLFQLQMFSPFHVYSCTEDTLVSACLQEYKSLLTIGQISKVIVHSIFF